MSAEPLKCSCIQGQLIKMFAKIVKIGTPLLKIKKNITVFFFSNSLTP